MGLPRQLTASFGRCPCWDSGTGQVVEFPGGQNTAVQVVGVLVLSAVVVGLLPGVALAAKPAVTTGAAANVTYSSARLNGSVDQNSTATTARLPVRDHRGPRGEYPAGRGRKPQESRAPSAPTSADSSRSTSATTTASSPRTRRAPRSASAERSRRATSRSASPSRQRRTRSGRHPDHGGRPPLTGTGNGGGEIVLQSNPFPYTQGFKARRQRAAHRWGRAASRSGSRVAVQLAVPGAPPRAPAPSRARSWTVSVEFVVSDPGHQAPVKRGSQGPLQGSSHPPTAGGAPIAIQKKTKSGRWVTIGGTDPHPQRREVPAGG